MALDLSRDAEVFDDPVTVAYRARTGESAYDRIEYIPYCQLSAVTKDDLKRDAALLNKQSIVAHVWKSHLGFIVPKNGDRFQVDAERCDADPAPAVYVVQWVDVADRDRNGPQRYRLVATRSTGVQEL